jgi:hypothetical protein
MEEKRNVYSLMAEESGGKRPTTKATGCRCMGNIKIDMREIGWHGLDFVDLAQDRDE